MIEATPDRIKSLRKDLGLSQRDFGLLIGYSSKTAKTMVYDIENGRRQRKPPASLVPLIIMLEKCGLEPLKDYIAKIKEKAGD